MAELADEVGLVGVAGFGGDAGPGALVVDVLPRRREAYEPGRSLGCLWETHVREMLASPAYQASLARHEALVDRYCRRCPYDGYCNREPLLNGHGRSEPGAHCSIGYPLHRRIEERLLAEGYDAGFLATRVDDLPHAQFVTMPA